ncbi:hypothetical protein ASE62_06165 [Rhizobium sp. Leaf202]|nr:hypothetical protein ASE62_06165 [Rhizobium sp. Leaf202]
MPMARNFIAWLRYVLDVEKPYYDYDKDWYADHKKCVRVSTCQKIAILVGASVFGLAFVLST